jgi:hypothetical protein
MTPSGCMRSIVTPHRLRPCPLARRVQRRCSRSHTTFERGNRWRVRSLAMMERIASGDTTADELGGWRRRAPSTLGSSRAASGTRPPTAARAFRCSVSYVADIREDRGLAVTARTARSPPSPSPASSLAAGAVHTVCSDAAARGSLHFAPARPRAVDRRLAKRRARRRVSSW